MKCTDCGKAVRPVVALDVDGTLSDYHGHFIHFAYNYTGRDLPNPSGYDGSVDLATYLGMDKAEYRQIKLAYRQGGMKRTQPIAVGAVDCVNRLRECGAEIWITTTRPYNRFDSTDPDTRHWLERYGILYDHLLYDDDKYKVLMDTVGRERIAGVLDDLGSNYDRAVGLGLPAVLYQTSYNAAIRRAISVPNMVRAGRLLAGAVDAWHCEHGRA